MKRYPQAACATLVLAASVLAASAAQAPARGDASIVAVVNGTAHQALFDVDFSGTAGIAVGAGGQVLVSKDGGVTWTNGKPPTGQSLLGVAIAGTRTIAVGQAGLVFVREGDGPWQTGTSGTAERLFAVGLNAANVAVAVGAFGKVLRSADGGSSWTSIAPSWAEGFNDQGLEPHLYDVHVGTDGTITLVGEFGLVLRSTDAGASWSVLHQGDASLFALELRDDGVGYAVGQGGKILRTVDGGATWVDVVSGSTANLLGVRTNAAGGAVATAMRDMLETNDGLAWHRVEWGDFSSAWYSGVAIPGTDGAPSALVVGHSGRIVRIGR